MDVQDLTSMWGRLPQAPAAQYREAYEPVLNSQIWIAVDNLSVRHLLVRVPDGVQAPESKAKGLEITIGRYQVKLEDEADYIDIACTDNSVFEIFAFFSFDLIGRLTDVPLATRAEVTADTLYRWRWFWDAPAVRMSKHTAIGLFGELWFLYRHAGVTPTNIKAWCGPDSSQHDFQWHNVSVEVKTTAYGASGSIVHPITDLDQLADPESGCLYLYSLKLKRDQLAANTLAILVERCLDLLESHPQALDAFNQKIAKYGYNPVDESSTRIPYRIVEEAIYEVDSGFPRLVVDSFVDGVPVGVVKVSYEIDMSQCKAWKRDLSQVLLDIDLE